MKYLHMVYISYQQVPVHSTGPSTWPPGEPPWPWSQQCSRAVPARPRGTDLTMTCSGPADVVIMSQYSIQSQMNYRIVLESHMEEMILLQGMEPPQYWKYRVWTQTLACRGRSDTHAKPCIIECKLSIWDWRTVIQTAIDPSVDFLHLHMFKYILFKCILN